MNTPASNESANALPHVLVGEILTLDDGGPEPSLGEQLTEGDDDQRGGDDAVVRLREVAGEDDDDDELADPLRTEAEPRPDHPPERVTLRCSTASSRSFEDQLELGVAAALELGRHQRNGVEDEQMAIVHRLPEHLAEDVREHDGVCRALGRRQRQEGVPEEQQAEEPDHTALHQVLERLVADVGTVGVEVEPADRSGAGPPRGLGQLLDRLFPERRAEPAAAVEASRVEPGLGLTASQICERVVAEHGDHQQREDRDQPPAADEPLRPVDVGDPEIPQADAELEHRAEGAGREDAHERGADDRQLHRPAERRAGPADEPDGEEVARDVRIRERPRRTELVTARGGELDRAEHDGDPDRAVAQPDGAFAAATEDVDRGKEREDRGEVPDQAARRLVEPAATRTYCSTLAENIDGRILSTPVAGGFVGAYIAMYASSNGQPSTNHADFDWFEYHGN